MKLADVVTSKDAHMTCNNLLLRVRNVYVVLVARCIECRCQFEDSL